jgi:hypothetical protein
VLIQIEYRVELSGKQPLTTTPKHPIGRPQTGIRIPENGLKAALNGKYRRKHDQKKTENTEAENTETERKFRRSGHPARL